VPAKTEVAEEAAVPRWHFQNDGKKTSAFLSHAVGSGTNPIKPTGLAKAKPKFSETSRN
jgi:hypothetical protein